MIKIGLTGSIGMGKSAVASMFIREGVAVFDADAEVHRLQAAGGALVAAIEARFPGSTDARGVNRAKLGPIVLGKPHELHALEKIIHPAVARARRTFLQCHRSKPFVVLDIPLLFEKRGWKGVDMIVVVSAPAWVQRKRVLGRAGMSASKFTAIKRLQTPDAVKRARADIVINTALTKVGTARQVRKLLTCLRQKTRR
jgi:dephospho-CoA kinase